MVRIQLIPKSEFDRVGQSEIDQFDRLAILADMCRANALASVKGAGSGHIGSSFSSLDIVTMLYLSEMNVVDLGLEHQDRDIYFSSKGHDVPGLYAVLFSLGMLPEDKFLGLRRIDGTCGHPDVSIPGCEASTGSLGMGISKAAGMALAKRMLGRPGRVFVMTGDGELQEGQIYEALQSASRMGLGNLNVIVDHNKVQTDRLVAEICGSSDLESRFRCFGWHTARCDGHDFRQLNEVFADFAAITDKPKVLIADTIKGRGVSFMEHPAALEAGGGLYKWHSGAPDDGSFIAGYDEIVSRVNRRLDVLRLARLALEEIATEAAKPTPLSGQSVADAFGKALVEIGERRKDLVVLDADLAGDCRVREFGRRFPERFIENGIAEQDMVTMAGGLALQGLLPLVNSFAAFLSSRANEQIYANACENTKVIYVNHYAGLIPAGPGRSHQSVRDVSLMGAMPNMTVIQPCNEAETRMTLQYCVDEADGNCALRLIIGPSPRIIDLPEGYRLRPGLGVTLRNGDTAVLFAYGPVMLNEALRAAESLAEVGFDLAVINMPWLNRVDDAWLAVAVAPYKCVYILEDHATAGGLGDFLTRKMAEAGLLEGRSIRIFGIEGLAAWGTPEEVLKHHGLDGESLAQAILADATQRV